MVVRTSVVVMWTSVVVAAVVATVVAGVNSDSGQYNSRPQSPRQQCAGYCKGSTKFGLRKGQTYVYQYEGVVSTGVEGTSTDTSDINVLAEVHLRVEETPCDLTLLVRNAQLFDSGASGLERSPREAAWASELEQWPLRLSYIDGRVDQLCPAAEDSSWTLDFKRALLSALQNSMPDLTYDTHLHERDISGTCDTTYIVSSINFDGAIEIVRHKDLQSCAGRGSHSLGLSGALPSSTPVVRSEQMCKQIISDNDGRHIARVECYETHAFTPFSNDLAKAGLRTQANLTMALVDIVQNVGLPNTDLFVNRRTSLKGEFTAIEPEELMSGKSVELTLKQLNDESQQGVNENVAQLFNQLVREMSALDDQQLVKIFDEIAEKRPRQYFLDALPLVGTSGSVKVMYLIYKAGEVSRDELESWLSALAFHKEPNLDMLDTLNLIIQEEGFHPKTWLAVGAVVHSYCQLDSACQDTPEVKSILEYLGSQLRDSCSTQDKEEQQVVVAALKALGNAGVVPSLDVLRDCFMNEWNALEVRLAAISATRRLPCSEQNKLPILQIFLAQLRDPELRIAAYLAVMQCPTADSLNDIRRLLSTSDANQVLSFVWSHLSNHNLEGPWSSWRKEIHEMLEDKLLANKFKTDIRKFSRNYATSLYSDILNMGASVDSNVVFSTNSYLPRSAYLNLTVDLFGEAVNLFEMGTRLEGFEKMVEDLFSPAGYFPDDSIQTMLRNIRSPEIENNDNVIQSMSDRFTDRVAEEPQGSIFARVFGNELYLTQFSSLNKLLDVKKPKKYSGQYFLDSLKSLFDHKQIDYSKTYRVINSHYVIPTVVGFPLKVQVNGTAAVSFEMKTELDIFQILKTKSGDLSFLLNPSAVLKIDGKMMVDAVFAQSSVETKASLKTNTHLDLKMSLDKLKLVDVVINVPRDKVEVIDVKSAVYVRHREQLLELEGVGELTQWDSCSGERVPTISGMRGCSQFVMRNASDIEEAPFFPLTGRFHYALILQKTDNFNAYKFHLEQQYQSSNGYPSGKLIVSLDTPGSIKNRNLSAELTFSTCSQNAHTALALSSPWTTMELTGIFVHNGNEWFVDLSTRVGGKHMAKAYVGMKGEVADQNMRFEPSLIVQSDPWGINFTVSSHFIILPNSRYSAGLTVRNPVEVLSISGEVTKDKGRYTSSVALKTTGVELNVSGRVVSNPSLMSCKAQADYTVGTRPPQGIEFATKLQSSFKNSLIKRHLTLNLKMTQWDQYNTKASWVYHQGDKHCDSKTELTVGRTQWIQRFLYHNSLQQGDKHLEFLLSLESPTKNVYYRTELLYKIGDDSIHAHALAQLNREAQFLSLFDYNRVYPGHRLMLELASPWQRATVKVELDTPAPYPDHKLINGTISVKWGDIVDPQWVTAGGKYIVQETSLSTHHLMEGWMEGKQWAKPLRLNGEWLAKSEQGLILSEWYLNVTRGTDFYKTSAYYIKNPSFGKHDLKVDLVLPDTSYSSSFVFINNLDLKNVTVRLDLEKTLYFTSQLQEHQFETQLFWNFLEDRSENVWVQYKGSGTTEVAIISMPGHYASLTVDKLGQGLSSMNITAVWGESEGSANNAILLSTYWLLDPNPYLRTSLPTVYTHIHLTTPFVGFEHQSFEFHMNGSSYYYGYPFSKDVHVSTKWQDQFVILDFNQLSRMEETHDRPVAHTTLTGEIKSSLEIVEAAGVKIDVLAGDTPFSSIIVDAAYNKWAVFAFKSTYDPSKLTMSVNIRDMSENTIILSGDLSIVPNSIVVKATLPKNKQISFESEYSNWPNKFQANLVTPIEEYEVLALQFNTECSSNRIGTELVGKAGKQFATFSTVLGKSEFGLDMKMNITSSSSLPDINLMLEHELYLSRNNISLKESAYIGLTKNGETRQSGQVLVFFTDEKPSLSSTSRSLHTVLHLPGHYSSSNYSYETQVKVTGVEVQHRLVHLWNTEETEVSLIHEGLSTVSGFLKKNGVKEAELFFKNMGNGNYRTDITSPWGYSLQHRFFVTSWKTWSNTLTLTTPNQNMIIKNVQTCNAENAAYIHKSTFFVNKEFSSVNFVINVDEITGAVNYVLFETTTPWSYPVRAKYDLIVNTGPTTKHAVEFKLKKDLEIKAEFDVTVTESSLKASFDLFSPFCKQLRGSINMDYDQFYSKDAQFYSNGILLMDNNQVSFDVELIKNLANPNFKFNFNDTNKNILHLSGSYDTTELKKEATLKTSYFEQEVYLNGHYVIDTDQIKARVKANTPFDSWKELSFDVDSVLSQKYSMFVIDMKKDDKFILISGTGTLLNDLIKLSGSMDYLVNSYAQKHSAAFELSTGQESGFIAVQVKNNETSIVDISLKGYTESEPINSQKSFVLNYKSVLSINGVGNTSLDAKYTCNKIKCELTGSTIHNNWHSSLKGENTFDNNGVGYFDFKVMAVEKKVELYVSHKIEEDHDSFYWHLSRDNHFIDGTMAIAKNTNGFNVTCNMESSVQDLRKISGNISFEASSKLLAILSSLSINDEVDYILNYSARFQESSFTNTADHKLLISIPFEGFQSINGHLLIIGYGGKIETIQGNATFGTTTNTISYFRLMGTDLNWDCSIDLPAVLQFSARFKRSSFEVNGNVVSSDEIPKLSFNLIKNNTVFSIGAVKDLNELLITFEKDGYKLKVSGAYNENTFKTVIEFTEKTAISLNFTSNILNWRDVSFEIKKSNNGNKIIGSVTKDKQHMISFSAESSYWFWYGEGFLSLAFSEFVMDMNVKYDLKSDLSVYLNYSFNGNTQTAKGKVTFLADSTQIELATPIQGFEDLTLIGNLNKNDKEAGFIFRNKEKQIDIALSLSLQRKDVDLKGTVVSGDNEFTLSLGAQNGTNEEPKSNSIYISAFKNKNSVFWLSFEGLYDLNKKAGIKISFSSYYHDQIYFEMFSFKQEISHTLFLNYISGNDYVYLVNTTLVKEFSRPQLLIESQFGMNKNYIDMSYNIVDKRKVIKLMLKQSEEKFINIHGEIYVDLSASDFQFALENKNILPIVNNMDILSTYNFINGSYIDLTFFVNYQKYFEVFMKSDSLASVDFHSSLKSSDYIKHSYDISLGYQLYLPVATISTDVNVNEDFYKCTANLTWGHELVDTFFQLTTNAGYGFENAVLSAHYEVGDVYSHNIAFTIDESKLFQVSCDIAYPSKISAQLVLPDTLFLPYVREISGEYKFTNEERKIKVHYKSDLNEKSLLDFLILLKNQHYAVDFVFTKSDPIINYKFGWLLGFEQGEVEFRTLSVWKNKTLFSAVYHKKAPEEDPNNPHKNTMNVLYMLFRNKNDYSLNVTATEFVQFQFVGIINSTDISLYVTHPSTLYHQQFQIKDLELAKSIGSEPFFQAYYRNAEMNELSFQYRDIVKKLIHHVQSNKDIVCFYNYTLQFNDRLLSIFGDTTFKHFSPYETILRMEHQTKVTGISEGPLRLYFEIDVQLKSFMWDVSTPTQNITFGGTLNIHPENLFCSNISLLLNSSSMPAHPFSVSYETDCKSNFHGSLRLFENDAREIHVFSDKVNTLTIFNTHGQNILQFKTFTVDCEFSKSSASINGTFGNDNMHIQMENSKYIHSLKLESSYEALRTLKFSHVMDSSEQNHLGVFVVKASDISLDWEYFMTHSNDGLIDFKINSDKQMFMKVSLDLISKKEILIHLVKDGKTHVGKGTIDFSNSDQKLSGEVSVVINGKEYRLSVERVISVLEVKAKLQLTSPTDDYFVAAQMNKQTDQPLITLKYKTPIYPFDFADINIWYSTVPVNSWEYFSIDERVRSYSTRFIQTTVGLSLRTSTFALDDVKLKIVHGDKYEVSFSYLTKKIQMTLFSINNWPEVALKTVIDFEGFTSNNLNFFTGKTSIILYLDRSNNNCFISGETPAGLQLLFSSESTKNTPVNNLGEEIVYFEEFNRTTKLLVGKEMYITFISQSNNQGQYIGNLYAKFMLEKVFNISYTINEGSVKAYMELNVSNRKLIDTQFLYSTEESDKTLSKRAELIVNKFMSVPEHLLIKPKVIIFLEKNDSSIVKCELSITNGLKNEFSFGGNFSVSLPSMSSFSVDSKPSIIGHVNLDVYRSEYTATANVSLQEKKIEVAITLITMDKLAKNKGSDFTSLEFGGILENDDVELYFNKNKLLVSLKNVENETKMSANLILENLDKAIYLDATVTYSPIFLLSINHTIFPMPCTVHLKVDLREQSVESALNVLYNGLEQQAFVNIYLDTNPKYAELMYLDIWKQTHDVSVHVDENDDEITLRGKINSPALDEHFLVVTLGKLSDKIDLNINDDCFFKAFEDDSRLLLDLYFGNDYKINFKSENQTELSVVSPFMTGEVAFKLPPIDNTSYLKFLLHYDVHQLNLEVNTDKLLDINIKKSEDTIFNSSVTIDNSNSVFDLQVHCDILEHKNYFLIKHIYKPILLTVTLNSSYLHNSDLQIILGMRNEDVVSGIFELKRREKLFSSYLWFNKINRNVNISFEAPLFSKMDKAQLSGVLNIRRHDCEVNLTASLVSADTLLSEGTVHLIKNDDGFNSGLVINSKLKNYENIVVSLTIPDMLFPEGKARLFLKIAQQPYDFGFHLCFGDNNFKASAVAQWQDSIISLELLLAYTPFYDYEIEFNSQFMETKLKIGAWIEPKYPITDYIYFLDIDGKRVVELSHSLIMQQSHYKSKLVLHTIYKGHEKYGIDCEFKTTNNSKLGKIVRILGSLPQFGNDLGIDFGFRYDSLLNYTVLSQFRIPFNNEVKVIRLFSLHDIQLNHQSFSKINHSLECSGLGSIGLELEVYGQTPFVGQTGMMFIETKFYVNDNSYYLNTKTNRERNITDLMILLETPFEQLRQGLLQLHAVNGIVGSELILSYNSDTVIGVNVTEDSLKTKGLDIFTKWRSVAVKYLYEEDKNIGVHGYLCWDIDNKNISQIGISFIADENDGNYYTDIELILPSILIPRLAVRGSIETANDYISSLLGLEFPGLNLEGRFYKECAQPNRKSELKFTWMVEGSTPRHIGLQTASEVGFEETKHYFTLQHFALENDVVLTLYSKETLCGVNMKYSPFKEDEITLELSYWLGVERSGVKLVALHLATNTLFFGVANISSTADHTQLGLSVSYLSDHEPSKIKYIEIYGKKNNKSPQLFVGVASNGNNMALGGSLWKEENSLRGITLEGRINQKDPLKLEMTLNKIDPEIKMELSYGLSRSYQMSAGAPSSNEVTAKLLHKVYGRPNLDLLATLRLNTSKILWGRLELPLLSHVSHEFYSSILAEYADVSLVSGAIVSGFSNFAQEEFSKKALLLLDGVSSTSEVLVALTYHELGVIKKGVTAVGDIAILAYKEDHLYMKTITMLLNKVSHTLYDRVSCVAQVLASITKNLLKPVLILYQQVWQVVESMVSECRWFTSELGLSGVNPLGDLRQVISQYQAFRVSLIQHAKLAVNNTLTQLDVWQWQCAQWMAEAEVKANQLTHRALAVIELQVRRVVNYKDTVLAGFSVLGDTMSEMLEIVVVGVYDIKEVRYTIKNVLAAAVEVYNRFSEFQLTTYIRQMSRFCDRVIQMVIEDFNRNFGEYEEYLVRAKMFLQGYYEELSKLPGVNYVKTTLNIIYQKAKWFWNYANLDDKLTREIRKYISSVEDSLYDWENLLDQEEGSLRSEYEYDEATHSFTFTQELPFHWRAFNELPYNFQYSSYGNEGPMKIRAQELSGKIQKLWQSLWRDTNVISSLVPPFSATALFTPRNIITFDSISYQLSQNCGLHLLAGDLQHRTFFLVADYHGQNERDVILIVEGFSVKVKENLEVYINGELEDLPSKHYYPSYYNLHIERKVNSISIESQLGFGLECNKFLNMCKFQLSGWYVGKTAGLLGTYNNEVLDDFVTPDHRLTPDNINTFTDSWALNPNSCEENEQSSAADDDDFDSLLNDSKCKEIFSSEFSPLSPCFSEENPLFFQLMCATKSSEDNRCASVYAYVTKCAAAGVQLQMPGFCKDNSLKIIPFTSDYLVATEEESKMSADVVFVVESAQCDSFNAEMFIKLSGSLAAELRAQGLSENQFGIVSFGNLGVNIHTFNGQLWTQDESLLLPTVVDMDGLVYDETPQYLSALETAAAMPFRPTASKLIVLLHCSQCPSTPDLTPPLVQSLLQNGAVVHVVQQDNLLNRQRKSVNKVIGFEASGAYPRSRFNKLVPPSPQLLKQITVPQDLCSPLALTTNGTVFSLDGVRRWKSWAERLATGALPTTPTKMCEHTVSNDNTPAWKCHSYLTNKNAKKYDQSSVDEDSDSSDIEAYSDYEEVDR